MMWHENSLLNNNIMTTRPIITLWWYVCGHNKKLQLLVLLLLLYPYTTTSFHTCSLKKRDQQPTSIDESDGVSATCPDNSKCCEIPMHSSSSSSSKLSSPGSWTTSTTTSFGCLPNNPHIKGPGTCCKDLTEYGGTTACPGYYTCATANSSNNFTLTMMNHDTTVQGGDGSGDAHPSFIGIPSPFVCILHDSVGNVMDIKPRYNLIPSPNEAISHIYGFPIKSNDKMGLGPVVAYYSNMGPIFTSKRGGGAGAPPTRTRTRTTMDSNNNIEAAIIIVHGSGRNADEYLYSMMVASHLQTTFPPENVLVVAPIFLAPEDGIYAVPVIMDDFMEMRQPMVWNETYPIAHTWRYGADALFPNDEYSSYDVMDAIVEGLLMLMSERKAGRVGEGMVGSLKRIIVAGHSAGGQFTQRWALTSNSPAWGEDHEERHWDVHAHNKMLSTKRGMKWNGNNKLLGKNSFELRVIVANPRSFAYLDGRRWVNSTHFAIPSREVRESCPTYNSWEWGLQPGGLVAPYKDRALELLDGDLVRLAERYAKRNVIYLAGMNDIELLHGSCEDDRFQGATRLERSSLFHKSLQIYFHKLVHSRVVVDHVGHDHSLMFQSVEARNVMFGD